MIRILRQLWCFLNGHAEFKFIRNIYGDEIIARNWMRSEYRCLKCGAYKLCPDLKEPQ